MRRRLTVLSVVSVLLVLSTGCSGLTSLLQVERRGSAPLPARPPESPTIQEMERALLKAGSGIAQQVYDQGAQPKAPAVGQLVDILDTVRGEEPTKPIAPPPTLSEQSPQLAAALDALRKDREAYDAKMADWWKQYEKARVQPATSKWTLSSGLVQQLLIVLGVAALGGIGGILALIKKIRALAAALTPAQAAAHALEATVAGIEKWKADAAMSDWQDLKPHLASAQDMADKKLIDGLRRVA